MQPASAINSHPEPESFMVFMIWFWLPTFSSSCQRSEQLTPGTLVASHPASSWIKMVLPPSWDRHFKIICQGLLGCSLTREPGTILCKFCLSPRYPSCIQSQRFRDPGNLIGSPYWMGPLHAGPSLAKDVDHEDIFWVDWPSHIYIYMYIYIFWAWRNNWCPFDHQYLYLHGIWLCLDLGVQFFQSSTLSVWRFRVAIGQIASCSPFSMCFFHTEEITCHWQRVEPTNDFPAQFIAQLICVFP